MQLQKYFAHTVQVRKVENGRYSSPKISYVQAPQKHFRKQQTRGHLITISTRRGG